MRCIGAEDSVLSRQLPPDTLSGDSEVTLPVYGNSNHISEDSCLYIPRAV